MSFWDSVGFAAIMAARDMARESKQQQQRAADFYQKCMEEIVDALSGVNDPVIKILQAQEASYYPPEMLDGLKYLGLYAFAKVLERQPLVTPEQDRFLDMMFRSLSFSFTKAQYLEAVRSKNALYQGIMDVVGISKSKAGTFWIMLFRSLNKNVNARGAMDDLLNRFANAVMRFAVLGNPNSKVALAIIEETYRAVDYQMQACRDIKPADVDILGQEPFPTHFDELLKILRALVRDGGEAADADLEIAEFQFETMILNSITDVVLQCRQPMPMKHKMIDYVLDACAMQFTLDAAGFLETKAQNSSFADLVHTVCYCSSDTLGTFWTMLHALASCAGRHDDAFRFSQVFMSFLMGAESALVKQYPNSEFDSTARKYVTNILESIVAAMNRA